MNRIVASVLALMVASPAIAERGTDGELRALYWQAAMVLNPYLSTSAKDVEPAGLAVEPLAIVEDDGTMTPRLAQEIPSIENGGIAEDYRSVTWKLKPGLLWSDGTPVTAEDVKFTADYCMAPGFGCAVLDEFENISSVEVIDETTLRINFDQPKYVPLQAFVGQRTPVLQKAQFEPCLGAAGASCTEQNFGPIGTGPFKVTNFLPGDVVQFDINPHYREADKPAFSSVTIKGGGNAMAAARAVLETGEFDFAWNLQLAPDVVAAMVEGSNGSLTAAFGSMVERIELNQTDPGFGLPPEERSTTAHPHPFLTDPAVRKALSMAIDRPLLAELTYGPAGKATCSIVPTPPAFAPLDPEACFAQDIAGANEVLDQAGWLPGANGIREKDGIALSLVFQTSVNSVRQDVQALIKQWWSEIGVQTELKTVEGSVFFGGDQENPDSLQKFHADAQMYTDAFYSPDPASFLNKFVCANIPSPENQWQGKNPTRFCDPAYDDGIAQLHRTADLQERQDLARELEAMLTHDGHYMLPLIHRGMVSAHVNSLAGISPNGWEGQLWNIADWYRTE
ncbi:peptide ABC transporter substrate-binding protein [Paracoccus seriniphilus]|uniref:Peptide/nickel transport system substrate-binding protein n=1 Tax=Paracoccus seriniphilus TaxID=184748 RepID=A0A239Q2Y4_9RHOB|nr:peptide ABC transporter substrate-binding protein [Paracoccus seriniphilus]WCR14539.1 peptide ABC transporter substrate-binding protein [Paracoccus seriniphilus]SNT76573.1 peptide/nickel transport system substrate-binding protein [Paracoccus seriniphilus]